jgi:hypothetical protein
MLNRELQHVITSLEEVAATCGSLWGVQVILGRHVEAVPQEQPQSWKLSVNLLEMKQSQESDTEA